MKNKLMLSALVAGTMAFLAPQFAKADTLILDNGTGITATPVILDSGTITTTPVVAPTMVTTPVVSPMVEPIYERSHFLNLGLGNLLDFGLF